MDERALRVAMLAPPCLPTPPPRYGGTELVVAELVDGLLEQGHEVVLYGAPGSTGGFRNRCRVESPLGTAVWPPTDASESRHAHLALERVARDGRFDLVHAHCPTAVAHAAELELPLVLTVHHDGKREYSEGYAEHPEVHYAFISGRQRALEVPVPRSAVVHHGVSLQRYRPGPGGGYAAFLGRFSACKGLHHAIDACARAGVPLRAAGRPHPPDLRYAREELAPRLEQPHVAWVGEVDHARKLALLRHACALLFPIEWEEPFGLVMVESMLCGTPVVAFARGAAPEIVDDGVTGFLVSSTAELAGAVRYLARGHFDRRACRARAAERFGARTMVARYLGLYARALAEARGAEVAASHA